MPQYGTKPNFSVFSLRVRNFFQMPSGKTVFFSIRFNMIHLIVPITTMGSTVCAAT